jgi:hypothetical protein
MMRVAYSDRVGRTTAGAGQLFPGVITPVKLDAGHARPPDAQNRQLQPAAWVNAMLAKARQAPRQAHLRARRRNESGSIR